MMKKKKSTSSNMREMSMLLVLVLIIILFTITTGGKMLKPMNVGNLINQNAYVVILAIGMLLCILTGGNIDLSVGSTVALIGACAGTFIIVWHMNVYVAIVLCLLIGILIGMWQGFWIAYVGIPPFVTTLSGMLMFRGATLLILNGLTLNPFPDEFERLSTGFIPDIAVEVFGLKINLVCFFVGIILALGFCVLQLMNRRNRKAKGYDLEPLGTTVAKMLVTSFVIIGIFYLLSRNRGIPTVLIILGILLLVYNFFTQKTVRGRHLYAIGGNIKAAELSGVKTKQMMFFAYTNMSFIAAIAGLVFAARLNAASPEAGKSFEMDAIASCFIGGASAYGGTGTIAGALIGALIMGVLNNGMSLMGMSQNLQQVVKGLVVLLAVLMDVLTKKNINLRSLQLRNLQEFNKLFQKKGENHDKL